jgi:hypothetical protein
MKKRFRIVPCDIKKKPAQQALCGAIGEKIINPP